MSSHRSTYRRGVSSLLATAVLLASAPVASPVTAQPGAPFEHVGSFFVSQNLAQGEDPATPTSAEIIDITPDGSMAVYTDGVAGRLGMIDISDPSGPKALGSVELPADPTSVALHDGYALVLVNTSADFDTPSGELLVIDLETRQTVQTLPLAGQPDAVAIAPGGGYAAITIENERDEDENDGLIPQPPAGSLDIVDLAGGPAEWTVRNVDLTGLAETAPDDPEPEFVDVNALDQAVVTLQENNHIVIVDLAGGEVIGHFSAGTVDLKQVDLTEEELGPQGNGLIELTESRAGIRREPDAVKWIDDDSFATANEGDYEDAAGEEGGSRSFTIFNVDGSVEFEAGNSLEHAIVRAGHYPEGRSENKGGEPEGLEVGTIGEDTYLFVAAERANGVAVFDISGDAPELVQLLPAGIGPEGLKLTEGGVLAVTSEVDGFDAEPEDQFPIRPVITLFSIDGPGAWSYPQLVSADGPDGLPIPWVAISGLSGDPEDTGTIWAVGDSYLAQPWLYRIDASATPAAIVERIAIGAAETDDQLLGEYDLEGVAARPEGGFWFASEGRIDDQNGRPNLIIRTDVDGAVVEAIELPESLTAGANSSGLEGVAVSGTEAAGNEAVWVAIQREWADDAEGSVKIGRYDVASAAWTFAAYPLDTPESPAGGWVGLSEITLLPDGRAAIVERDNQPGQQAAIKRIYGVDPASVTFVPHGEVLPVLEKTLLRDVLSDLDAASISVPDKLEGLAVTADGSVYLATDNDGVDENYGETVFIGLGSVEEAFAR